MEEQGHPKIAHKWFDYSKDRIYKGHTYWKRVDRKCPGCLTTKKDQVIKETEHNLHGPNQPDLVSMARIKDAVSLEPPSHLINQELRDESTGENAGYLPRLATVKFLFITGKDQPSWITCLSLPLYV